MCFAYRCYSCRKESWQFCKEYVESGDSTCNNITLEKPWGNKRLWCSPCVTIKAVIRKLNELVFREPWLLTDGVAGAPEKQEWEKEKEIVADDPYGDGFTAEQRKEVRAEAEAAVMKRWALMHAQQMEEEGEKEAVVVVLEGNSDSNSCLRGWRPG